MYQFLLRLEKLVLYPFHYIIFVMCMKKAKIQFDGKLLVTVASHPPQSFAPPPERFTLLPIQTDPVIIDHQGQEQEDHHDVQDVQDHLSAVLDSASLNASYCLFTLANG